MLSSGGHRATGLCRQLDHVVAGSVERAVSAVADHGPGTLQELLGGLNGAPALCRYANGGECLGQALDLCRVEDDERAQQGDHPAGRLVVGRLVRATDVVRVENLEENDVRAALAAAHMSTHGTRLLERQPAVQGVALRLDCMFSSSVSMPR
jgi:hypothetical protein